LSERQLLKRKQIEGVSKPLASNGELTRTETGFSSHADLLEKHHREWAEKMVRMKAHDDEEDAEAQDFATYLTDRVIRHAIELEERARHLLIEQLPVGSKAELLLKADRNVQLRDLKMLEEDGVVESQSAGYIGNAPDLEGLSTLEQVNAYRHTYAGLLAAASELKGLKGIFYFNRTRSVFMD
jgi:potassium channel subfamily K, other eukaryote